MHLTPKKRIILKLTGEVIKHSTKGLDTSLLENIADQIRQLSQHYQFGIVMGGGNFFRGAQRGTTLSATAGHYVGMMATIMNGLIIQDILEQKGIRSTLFTAVECEVGLPLSPQNIAAAGKEKDCFIFSGGTGNPYFTTDTTAVVRSLQIEASQVWKCTNVDGIYNADPATNSSATFIPTLSYQDAINKRLGVMDLSAFALAEQNNIEIRIFNIFVQNALLQAARSHDFGSIIGKTI